MRDFIDGSTALTLKISNIYATVAGKSVSIVVRRVHVV